MKKNNAFRRAVALMAALSITVSLAAPAFADTYYIDDGDITITKNADGSQTIQQNGTQVGVDEAGEETIITNSRPITTQESDLEGPAAEDSGFGPVVEDNYQPAPPAQPEDAEEPKDADQPESADQPENTDQQKDAEESEDAEEPKDADQPEGADQQESAEEPKSADQQESAGQQAQPLQAAPAPAAAPAAPTSVITLINHFANTVLNLTLKDVKIDVSRTGAPDTDKKGKAALSVQGEGDVEIELDGKNELKSGAFRAGLEKTSKATGTLTLKDDKKDDNQKAGSLTATGGDWAAGIGGQGKIEYHTELNLPEQELYDTSNITITGGTVNAAGGSWGAGIGGGNCGKGKNITITDGTVTARGGYWSAGIGGGAFGSGEDITITDGTVNAVGGKLGAGIGGGRAGYRTGYGKNITINGGTVNATGGDGGDDGVGGAGIGGGAWGNGYDITINDGTVNATGGKEGGAGIGGGSMYDGINITINGGTVTARGGYRSAGIGGGGEEYGNGKNIIINGGRVNAAGGIYGAGIGGGIKGKGEAITINGGTVNAAGGDCGAGIGGGAMGSGSNVTVSGAAQVTATVGKSNRYYGTGATIGNGGNRTPGGEYVDGEEIQADISRLLPGYIHHIIYDPDLKSEDNPDGIVREWWEPERPQPTPGTECPGLHVETLEGDLLPFDARQQGSPCG